MLNTNKLYVTLYSNGYHQNIISQIGFTYIIISKFTFSNKLVFYRDAIYRNPATNPFPLNLAIPSLFNPYLFQNCIIGLRLIFTQYSSPSEIFLIDTGTYPSSSISTLRLYNFAAYVYNTFCTKSCTINYVTNYALSNTNCYPCSNFLAYCLNCTSSSVCILCATDYTLSGNICIFDCRVNDSCICTTGYIKFNRTCVSACGDGYKVP